VCLPLLILPCAIKSRSSLLAPAHPGGPGKRAVKGCGGVYRHKTTRNTIFIVKNYAGTNSGLPGILYGECFKL